MKELVFLQVADNELFYKWQVDLWLYSLREIGKSNKAISLIYVPKNKENTKIWDDLIKKYPESKFYFYKSDPQITYLRNIYIPIIRPYCLSKFFKEFPEMEQKAVFYCDCDIIFTSNLSIDKFIDDNTNYLSNCFSYISATYFDSKIKDVLPEKLEEYKKIDVLDGACKLVGINREIAVKNDLNSGGAQYLLKNIDYKFWDKVLVDCINLRSYFTKINRTYFKDESKGFQGFCSDMWAVLWGLWYREQECKVVPEMEFAWSSDNIEKISRPNVGILHNAGIVSTIMPEVKNPKGEVVRPSFPLFYKGAYRNGQDPREDKSLEKVLNNEYSKTLCNHYYLLKLIETKQV